MKKLLIIFLLCVLISVFLYQGIFFPKDFELVEDKIFLVEKGESLSQIGENLEKESLIKSKFFFYLYILLKGDQSELQAGNYSLNSRMNVAEIAKKITSGVVAKERITIIEGWNLRDVGFYFEGKGMFLAEELFELVGFPAIDYSKATDLPEPKDFSEDYSFLKEKPQNVGLEGYLFPDTYELSKDDNLEEIVRKMLDNFDRKLDSQLREETKGQDKTIFEIITMASLLEKEVRTEDEKELVAGILWKRLENNMPLQVDATITYITGKKTTKISKEETKIDSPYNTYQYRGLPLGPICNPGLESILAAMNPRDSEYWYYLSVPGGETIFSKTLEEHNRAKAEYLK
jgi:UPF0755 protein